MTIRIAEGALPSTSSSAFNRAGCVPVSESGSAPLLHRAGSFVRGRGAFFTGRTGVVGDGGWLRVVAGEGPFKNLDVECLYTSQVLLQPKGAGRRRVVGRDLPRRPRGVSGSRVSSGFRVGTKLILITIAGLGMVGFGAAFALIYYSIKQLPPDFNQRWRLLITDDEARDKLLRGQESRGSTVIYDRRGELVATLIGGQRPPCRLEDMSSSAWQAVVASEDKRFFEHRGVDFRGLSRAVVSMARTGGGSTITQQLAKNLFLSNVRTMSRKVMELILALQIEQRLDKREILHLYLNRAYWGHGMYGIESASALYFNKSPGELSIGESALLAGILPAPEAYSPHRNPRLAKQVQAKVLRRMVSAGFIDEATAQEAVRKPIQLALTGENSSLVMQHNAPYFVDEVLHDLIEQYGVDTVLRGGLSVYTTLDLQMQQYGEKLVKEGCGKDKEQQAALVAIDPKTGGILSMVGGKDYEVSPYNRAIRSLRPPGSSFKPFVYLTALCHGSEPGTIMRDEPVVYRNAGAEDFMPVNYDRKFRGQVTLEECLVKSLNAPTVALAAAVGVDKILRMCKALGIETEQPQTLGVSLGAGEVTVKELATAYATIASGGIYNEPYMIERVEDFSGTVIEEHIPCPTASVNEEAVIMLNRMLEQVVERGTGQGAQFGRPCAGKTGTTDEYRDAWFSGYTPQISTVVWVGRDDNSTISGYGDWRDIAPTGAVVAAPIWNQFMDYSHIGEPVMTFSDVFAEKSAEEYSRLMRGSKRIPSKEELDALNEKERKEDEAMRERGMNKMTKKKRRDTKYAMRRPALQVVDDEEDIDGLVPKVGIGVSRVYHLTGTSRRAIMQDLERSYDIALRDRYDLIDELDKKAAAGGEGGISTVKVEKGAGQGGEGPSSLGDLLKTLGVFNKAIGGEGEGGNDQDIDDFGRAPPWKLQQAAGKRGDGTSTNE